MDNLSWILPLCIALVIIGIALWVVMMWLSSRGKFMFLHCVALDRAEIGVPWHKFAREGNSLFLFRLVLWLIGMVADAAVGGGGGCCGHQGWSRRGEADLHGILTLVGIGLALIPVGLVVLHHPQAHEGFRGSDHVPAGQDSLARVAGIPPPAVGQLRQLRAVSSVPTGAGHRDWHGCVHRHPRDLLYRRLFLMIPYLGAVLLLPISVFQRSYSIHYLAQYGREYDVFPPVTAPAPSPPLAQS